MHPLFFLIGVIPVLGEGKPLLFTEMYFKAKYSNYQEYSEFGEVTPLKTPRNIARQKNFLYAGYLQVVQFKGHASRPPVESTLKSHFVPSL